MAFNLTSIGNNTGILDLSQKVNSVLLDGWLGTFMLIAIFFIMAISFTTKSDDAKKSVAVSAFICTFLAMLLRLLSLTNTVTVYIFAILAFGAMATLKSD